MGLLVGCKKETIKSKHRPFSEHLIIQTQLVKYFYQRGTEKPKDFFPRLRVETK